MNAEKGFNPEQQSPSLDTILATMDGEERRQAVISHLMQEKNINALHATNEADRVIEAYAEKNDFVDEAISSVDTLGKEPIATTGDLNTITPDMSGVKAIHEADLDGLNDDEMDEALELLEERAA